MAGSSSKYFFWAKETQNVVNPFWWMIIVFFVLYFPFTRPWWWIITPMLLVTELRRLYLWWISWDYAYARKKWFLLEIVPPREILIPLKAMEDIFATLWPTLYDNPNFREMYCDGTFSEYPNWMSFEITSIEGKIHFYMRVSEDHRSAAEAALYSHYPDLEIHEVQDYVKNVPSNIPNDEWNMYGEDFIQKNTAAYPIKTYEKFFEPQGEKITAEEKRIDPMNSMLEAISKLGPGEQYWTQFIISPAVKDWIPDYAKEGKEIIGKVTRKPSKREKTAIDQVSEVFQDVIFGPKKTGEGEKATYSWAETAVVQESGEREMLMTPGEREIVTEVENKLKKPVFKATLRGVYVAKRKNWNVSHRFFLRTYMAHFSTENMNQLGFDGSTRTKVHYVFRKRRVYLRSRKMMRNYVQRFPPYFPNRLSGGSLLNPEELASLFHFPFKMSGMAMPTMNKIEAKKAGPPPNLPVE